MIYCGRCGKRIDLARGDSYRTRIVRYNGSWVEVKVHFYCEAPTPKEVILKRLIVVFLLLLLLGVALEATAQEILKGKIPVAVATCSVDKNYVMGKNKPLTRSCILFMDDSDTGWVLIYDKNDDPAVVVEIDPKDESQKIRWRKGDVST